MGRFPFRYLTNCRVGNSYYMPQTGISVNCHNSRSSFLGTAAHTAAACFRWITGYTSKLSEFIFMPFGTPLIPPWVAIYGHIWALYRKTTVHCTNRTRLLRFKLFPTCSINLSNWAKFFSSDDDGTFRATFEAIWCECNADDWRSDILFRYAGIRLLRPMQLRPSRMMLSYWCID